MKGLIDLKLINAATGNITGDWFDVSTKRDFNIATTATGSVGGTVVIQARQDSGTIQEIDSKLFTTSMTDSVVFWGAFKQMRAVLSGYTGGTFTVELTGR